jgi:RNase H-fold protein (predicted Holliday junction resolvase)
MYLAELWGTSDFDSNSYVSSLVQIVNFIKKQHTDIILLSLPYGFDGNKKYTNEGINSYNRKLSKSLVNLVMLICFIEHLIESSLPNIAYT